MANKKSSFQGYPSSKTVVKQLIMENAFFHIAHNNFQSNEMRTNHIFNQAHLNGISLFCINCILYTEDFFVPLI